MRPRQRLCANVGLQKIGEDKRVIRLRFLFKSGIIARRIFRSAGL